MTGAKSRRVAVLAVLAAATFWATTGPSLVFFLKTTSVDGVTLALLRAATATIILWLWLALRSPQSLQVQRSALPGLAGYGLWAITLFYAAVSYGMAGTSASVGTTILYLAPALVTVGGAIWLGEPLIGRKIVALVMSFLGILLVVRLYDPGNLAGTPVGFAWILLAALVYAGYSLFGKSLLGRHSPATILAWYLLFGTIGLLLVKLAVSPGEWPPAGQLIPMALVLGVLTTLLPTSLYLFAMTRLPSSEASILSAVEPVVAVSIAATLLGERLQPLQMAGGVLVLASVVLLNLGGQRRRIRSEMTRPVAETATGRAEDADLATG
jgi:drug/metabolite transporter (DMT)-like permease